MNLYKILKPGGQLIYTTFDRLPLDEPYKKLDNTKWKILQHSRVLSPFSISENPFEEYKNLTREVGFQENLITMFEDQDMYFKNESITRCKTFLYYYKNRYIQITIDRIPRSKPVTLRAIWSGYLKVYFEQLGT